MRCALVFALALAATPAFAAPCAGFTDVDDSSPFCVNVEWMKNRGITLGLTPTQFGPNSPVTRLQMAAFMYRLGFQNAFLQGGNAFGAVAQVGTTDNQAVEIVANGARMVRLEPNAISPNVLHGHETAGVYPAVHGVAIGGGGSNLPDPSCTNGLGCLNFATDNFATIAGGESNIAGDGTGTLADASHATVGGGFNNRAVGRYSTVAGGRDNFALNLDSTVGGGVSNQADINGTVAGGIYNIAGVLGTVLGGAYNYALGDGSIAGGVYARAVHPGCIVLADYGGFANAKTTCGGPNQFIVRARGGVYFFTGGESDATYTGVYVNPGSSSWLTYSDRDGKHEVAPVNASTVLERVVALPMSTWRWKNEGNAVRHMGPMAQDFHAAFGLGPSDRHIATVDADGVAFAAIQGLNAKVEELRAAKDAEIVELRRANEELRRAVVALSARLDSPAQLVSTK